MTWQIAVVLAVLAGTLVCLGREWLQAELVVFAAAGILLAAGILDTPQILSVFSNEGAITVICMFILAVGLEKTGAIDQAARLLSRWAGGASARFLSGLLISATAISAFLPNTAVVLIFLPVVLGFCRGESLPPSRFLMPLSYAAMLGGCCTLIGTSTTLLVNGVAVKQGQAPFGMFEVAPVGVFLALAGLCYLLVAARFWIPDRESFLAVADQIKVREYLTEAVIVAGSPLVGKRLRETPLAKLADVRIIEIARGGEPLLEPIDSILFAQGDRLLIKTVVASVTKIQALSGIEITPNVDLRLQTIRTAPAVLVEGVVAPRSGLIGQTVRLVNFRQRYNVLILAVHRQGENIRDAFEDVKLRFGDVLLMEGTQEAVARITQDPDFLMLTDVSGHRRRLDKAPMAMGIVAGMVLLSTLGVFPIVALAFLACLSMLLTGCLQPREAYRSVQWDTILLIFGMLALGEAFEKTGAARWLVGSTLSSTEGLSPAVALAAFYLVTNVLTALLSNNAVGILMTPVAIQAAQALGVDVRPFLVAAIMAASLDFSTPIGYQTNMIIYSAGGYRFSDFMKVGGPLNLLLWIAASLLIPVFFPFHR